MARAVLTAVAALIACTHAATVSPTSPLIACPSSLRNAPVEAESQYEALRAAVESGPLLRTLVKERDGRLECTARLDDAGIVLEYRRTSDGAVVTARRNPAVEFTKQELILVGLTEQDARALLRELESTSFPPAGCGIRWDRPSLETNGRRRTVYRGDVCNCGAAITLTNEGTEATLWSAC